MKKVRQIFVGVMLVVLCIGFTSCSDISEDVDPIDITENVLSIDGEDTEDENGGGTVGTGG